MTKQDEELLRKAMEYVERWYPEDCPYYIQLISLKIEELKKEDL
jgi:hypothetical protein